MPEKKIYEIAYAVFRVAGNAGNAAFTSYMDSYVFGLLDAAGKTNKPAILQYLSLIRQFAGFSNGVGILHPKDAELIIAECNNLYSAIKESGNTAIRQLPDTISGIADESGKRNSVKPQRKPIVAEGNVEVRQSKILEIIRQSGNCRIKDLQDALPDVSERTLRYDIERLVETAKIERFGQGGPSVGYRIPGTPIAMPAEGGYTQDVHVA